MGMELKLFGEARPPAVHADVTVFDLHDTVMAAVADVLYLSRLGTVDDLWQGRHREKT
jgi:hypothetical protein